MAPHFDALAPAPLDPGGHELHRRQPSSSASSPSTSSPAATTTNARPNEGGLLGRKIVLAGLSNQLRGGGVEQTAALFTNPADLIKVRQQLELKSLSQSGSSTTRSTNALRTLVKMVRAEGIMSIYKGLSGSLLREAFYSGIRMGGYDLVKASIIKTFPLADPNGFGTKLAAGMASGIVGAAVANPADLLKVRMQAPSAHGTLRQHAYQIYSANGLKGMYKAVGPTTFRAGILTSCQLGCYDHAKHV
ncbi:hypothetical protein NBRC10513v2_001367 [Rhodotorula toruloides]